MATENYLATNQDLKKLFFPIEVEHSNNIIMTSTKLVTAKQKQWAIAYSFSSEVSIVWDPSLVFETSNTFRTPQQIVQAPYLKN